MNKFLKGEWESLWVKCMAKGHARQDKLAANPLSALSRTSAQKDAMAQKQARAGNLSKGGQQSGAFETVRFAVTTFPSFAQVFTRHGACTGAAICDNVFIVAPLAEGLALAAELKQVLKQDLDLDLDVM